MADDTYAGRAARRHREEEARRRFGRHWFFFTYVLPRIPVVAEVLPAGPCAIVKIKGLDIRPQK